MKLRDKYISASENSLKPDKDKIEISNESFVLAEMLEELINKIERVRTSL